MKKIIEDAFQKAEEDSEQDYHVSSSLRNHIVEGMKEGRIKQEEIEEIFTDLKADYEVLDAVEYLSEWIYEDDYQSAESAIDSFQNAFEQAKQDDWQNVSIFSILEKISLEENLGGHSVEDDIKKLTNYLKDEFSEEDVHLGNTSRLLDKVIDHASTIDQAIVEEAIDWCEERIDHLETLEDYANEKSYIRKLIDLKKSIDQEVEDEKNRLVASWEREIEKKDDRQIVKASLLEQALDECVEFLDEQKKREWKKELVEANEKSIPEMSPIGQEFTTDLRPVKDFQEKVENLIENKSEVYALYSIANSKPHYTDLDSFDVSRPQGIVDIISHRTVTRQGGSFSSENEDRRTLMNMRVWERYASQALKIVKEEFEEEDFIELLDISENIDESQMKFFRKIAKRFFEENYVDSYHIGVPHLERVLVEELKDEGKVVTAIKKDGTITSALDTLFEELDDYYDTDYPEFLQYSYTEREGFNHRNLTAHGIPEFEDFDFSKNIFLLLDMLNVITTLEGDTFEDELGEAVELDLEIQLI